METTIAMNIEPRLKKKSDFTYQFVREHGENTLNSPSRKVNDDGNFTTSKRHTQIFATAKATEFEKYLCSYLKSSH